MSQTRTRKRREHPDMRLLREANIRLSEENGKLSAVNDDIGARLRDTLTEIEERNERIRVLQNQEYTHVKLIEVHEEVRRLHTEEAKAMREEIAEAQRLIAEMDDELTAPYHAAVVGTLIIEDWGVGSSTVEGVLHSARTLGHTIEVRPSEKFAGRWAFHAIRHAPAPGSRKFA